MAALESVWSPEVKDTIVATRTPATRQVQVDGQTREVSSPFPSPADWRDHWIYFVMVDRFSNPTKKPAQAPYDVKTGVFQGGTLEGIRAKLPYLKELGVGAIWITPVLKNARYRDTYYGYGIQDFLKLDPRFASNPGDTEGELRALVDEAHARGIYVIFDIVLNHTGDLFAYVVDGGQRVSAADFWSEGYAINWRDGSGNPNPAWTEAPADGAPGLDRDAAVWPKEFRANRYFRCKGKGGEQGGDFESLKEFVTAEVPVRDALIRAHQYLIAKYDIDGFRIDTLKFIEEDFARTFGNAMREFAQSIGKKNFFSFGEVYDEEEKIARFIGRRAMEKGELTGVDAALDFPLFFKLPGMLKNQMVNDQQVPPAEIARLFERRKEVQRGIISSHSEATRFFVTFLDNHDQKNRFYYRDPANPGRYDDQLTLSLGCLFGLAGIPCLYYGTEQGLSGAGNSDEAVREALWGKPSAFDPNHPFYRAVQKLARVRAQEPALRYGRQYFRPISGDGQTFGLSPYSPGVLVFSRLLSDREVMIAANTDTAAPVSVHAIVDRALHPDGTAFRVLYSNKGAPTAPGSVRTFAQGVTVNEVDGAVSRGPVSALRLSLQPMEVQVLST